MFTGLVEELGRLESLHDGRLRIAATRVVDGVGEVVTPVPDLRVRVPDGLLRYLVEKGSVTVDGVSLTVVEALDDGFTVAIIPHTAEVTTLGTRQPGDLVNLEVDVMAEYVERLVSAYLPPDPGAAR